MGQTVSSGLRGISSFMLTPTGRRRNPNALHAAAKAGDVDQVAMLIREEVPVDLCNEVGCTPLHFAAREGHEEVVQQLLQAGARTGPSNTVGSTPLHWAADEGHRGVVELLCRAGVDVNSITQVRNTALHLAAKKGHAGVVESLLHNGASATAINSDRSRMQPWDGEASLAQRSGGAGLGRGSCPATVSLHCWPTEAENLRPGRHSLTPSRRLPLHVAARYGHTEAVVLLLEADCGTVNIGDKDGRTPLHLAALGGHVETVDALLDMDADVSARDRMGATPDDLASESGLDVFGTLSSVEAAVGDSLGAGGIDGGQEPPSKPGQALQAPATPAERSGDDAPTNAADRPWTGLAGELLRRLDPRLRYLVTTDALQSLEQAEGLDSIPSAVDDCDDDGDGLPLVATLSGIDLQFDYEALQWERPAENLLRHSLRGTAGLAPLQIAAAAAWPAGSVQPTAPPCPSPLLREIEANQTWKRDSNSADGTIRFGHLRIRYRTMQYEELQAAASGFTFANQLGEGGFGAVYRGEMKLGGGRMPVAIKVLDENSLQGSKEFRCEVKVLSRVRHPHVVKLLGSCPARGCLVYEFLSNGSLEDRLECEGGTTPLTWQQRVSIAFEMACGLLYLHNCRPEAIVHRDFKPANVLLDDHMTVKLGDVGLARLAPELAASMAQSHVKDSVPVGTIQYIDPEYMRTGQLSPLSDVYSLGITLLQLLTALSPSGVVEAVENALENDNLSAVLDKKADWPLDVAESLARLALNAAEMKRRKRPDLEVGILPVLRDLRASVISELLERILQRVADGTSGNSPPVYFVCPISQELMSDPVVARDGFAYERASLVRWLEETDVSPMTNTRLEDSTMEPAPVLIAAINRWQAIVSSRA